MDFLVFADGQRLRFRRVSLAVAGVCAAASAVGSEDPWPTAQLAPVGYTAAINTPTADVLPWGAAALGWTNSHPERARVSNSGPVGSLNMLVGVLPGLELAGRLAYDGDLNCNTYQPGCDGRQRDLSAGGKFQLPIELPLDTRLAVGVTDYGGAATTYRQAYGVATGTWGPLDLSLGYSRALSAQALMDGFFGSTVLRLNERWAAALENDTREWRAGMHYTQPLTDTVSVQAGLSRKLTDRTAQQSWQATVALNVALGQKGPSSIGQPTSGRLYGSQVQSSPSDAAASRAVQQSSAELVTYREASSKDVVDALVGAGFRHVTVKRWSMGEPRTPVWHVRAEPGRWRQSQLDALAAALDAWRTLVPKNAGDQLLLTLTYQQEPMLHARTSARCLDDWLHGYTRCAPQGDYGVVEGRALEVSRRMLWPATLDAQLEQTPLDEAHELGVAAWMPQVELGPGLRNSVGTEYGLFDYSLALEAGLEVGLLPGLFWQGLYSAPVSHSDDYSPGKVYGKQAFTSAGMDTSMLSYWKSLPYGVSTQLSAGKLTRNESGGQLDLLWMNESGRWRVSAMAGRYRDDSFRRKADPILGISAIDGKRFDPALIGTRFTLVPGAWHLDMTAGKFFNGDQGYRLKSVHWFGNTSMSLYYRKTHGADLTVMPKHAFMGFEFNIPLGPKAASAVGPLSVRGRDRFSWGLETKVGESNNYLTQGYGVVPRLRHGLLTDVTDHDRNGHDDLASQLFRLRALMQAR